MVYVVMYVRRLGCVCFVNFFILASLTEMLVRHMRLTCTQPAPITWTEEKTPPCTVPFNKLPFSSQEYVVCSCQPISVYINDGGTLGAGVRVDCRKPVSVWWVSQVTGCF